MVRKVRSRVTEVAERQHGVVTRAQLLDLGVSAAAIDWRLARGTLRPVFRGVYAPGHAALRDEGRWLAATLAYGPGAVLSHMSAAHLWGMRIGRDKNIHVTTSVRNKSRPGLVVHHSRMLTGADVTRERGIAVTTSARTLVDLAAVLSYRELRTLADHGVRLDAAAVRRAQARAGSRRGSRAIAHLLGDGGLRTRSGLERQLLALCGAAGLPRPLINARIVGRERDAAWPQARVVVEVDGHAFHAPRGAREDDHERDAELVLAGWRVLRFTDTQLEADPGQIAQRIAALLADTASPRGREL
jgi:hypothetical protein